MRNCTWSPCSRFHLGGEDKAPHLNVHADKVAWRSPQEQQLCSAAFIYRVAAFASLWKYSHGEYLVFHRWLRRGSMALKSSIGAFGDRINVAAVERKTLEAVCPGEVMRNLIVLPRRRFARVNVVSSRRRNRCRVGSDRVLAFGCFAGRAFRKAGRGARKADFRREAFCGMQAGVCDKVLKL
jgi:hypothetical protein